MTMRRIAAYDYLRVILAILVVAIHADTITASPTNYLGGMSWWLAAATNSLGRIAVPLFVMLSGSLLLDPQHKERGLCSILGRLGIPLLFWIPALYVFNTFYLHQPFSWSIGHLYYLFIALGLGLVTPYLRARRKLIRPSVGMLLLVAAFILDLINFSSGTLSVFFSLPLLWLTYLGYYILGFAWRLRLPPTVTVLASLGLAGFGAYALYLGNTYNLPGNYFWSHFAPNIMASVLLIWSAVKSIEGRLPSSPLITSLSAATYGIYLIHPFVLSVMEQDLGFAIHLISGNLAVYYIAKISLATVISYLLVAALRKVAPGRFLLGG